MSKSSRQITFVYPHQLFHIRRHPALEPDREVQVIEDPLFFRQFRFHKQKLVLHRASLQAFADYLRDHDFLVSYWESTEDQSSRDILDEISSQGDIREVHVVRPTDDFLSQVLESWAGEEGVELVWHESPMFITSRAEVLEYLEENDIPRMEKFYRWQRRRLDILIDESGNSKGGQWNFDEDNREKLPADVSLPQIPRPKSNHWVEEAKTYVEEKFSLNYGFLDSFFYPVTRKQALSWLDDFLEDRFDEFGPYEDAITQKSHPYLFHSVLSPVLNIGLLTPQEVIEKALDYARNHEVRINSLEGFVRQIIGWREYVRGVYLVEGPEMRGGNHFGAKNNLGEIWWQDENFPLEPVASVIRKVREHAYAHHIERLMIMSNIFTLVEADPHQVYGWFMELFIDAYDWVMVPNVYSMGLFADGGIMATKPYVSSSNYLSKMSDYLRDKDNPDHWSYVWDALYWSFLDKHRETFASNPRTSAVLSHLGRMGEEKLALYKDRSEEVKKQLSEDPHFSTEIVEWIGSGQ